MIWRSDALRGETPKTFFHDITASQHEKEITAFFGRRTKFQPGDPVVEAPVCFLLFTNRSGSNFLGDVLNSTGAFCGFGEYTNCETVINHARSWQAGSLAEYYHRLHQSYGQGAPTFGLKVNVQQLLFLVRAGIIPGVFPQTKWIWIQRADLLGQAISLYLAQATQQWTSEQEGNGTDVPYSFSEIASRMRGISKNNANLARIVGGLGLDPAVVIYEHLLRWPGATIRQVFLHLGMEPAPHKPRQMKLKRQEDERKAEFKAQFAAELAHAIGKAPRR